MNKDDRQAVIVDDLGREPALRVNEMAHRYGVSPETIRRDLVDLTERGLINRTYGGAVRLISHEPAISEREHINVLERQSIARTAVSLIVPEDVLMIGGGITTRFFAKALALFKEPITVITPSFPVSIALGACPNICVHVLPGEFNGRESLVEGAETLEALGRLRATKAILGATGLDTDGPSDAAIPAGRIYQMMSERSADTLLVADSSKFERTALSRFAQWGSNVRLITDTTPSPLLLNAIQAAGSEITLSGE